MKYEQQLVSKILNKEELSKRELSNLAEYSIDSTYGENRRWTRSVTSICKLKDDEGKDRFFELNWDEGLTECQENEFYEQPFEVAKKTYEKVVTLTEWVRVE